MSRDAAGSRSAGYGALITRYGLDVVPNWHGSHVGGGGALRTARPGTTVEEAYPQIYWPGDSLGDHLEFALKYDGTNLGILAQIFSAADVGEIQSYVISKPTGKYARRIWFLYEFLTGKRLPIDDLQRSSYVDVLDADSYYVSRKPRRVRRQRVNDNLLGDRRFCPVVRRTDLLRHYEDADFERRSREVVRGYSADVLRRALGHLYTKETRSSFEIEDVRPSANRIERFVALLKLAETEDFCSKTRLIELQNRVVDERYKAEDYRDFQNYIGQSISWTSERVHYVCPRPEQLADLMDGLIASHVRMAEGLGFAIAHAAAIAYGFVYLHPFEDGNGRIHRFLIHNVLSRRGFTPPGLVFPVSAAMVKDPAAYDASLEAFSSPLMQLVEYSLDDQGRMTVQNDVGIWYRYLDLTAQAEALARFVDTTIESELVEELAFLVRYDRAKRAVQEIVDMPDRRIDLLIKLCAQNEGRLSLRKREDHFGELTDEEIHRLQAAVASALGDAEQPQ